jgi:hypothetical protein
MAQPAITTSERTPRPHGARGPARNEAPGGARRRVSRLAYHVHLWVGVVFTIALVAIAITGILLNHKRGLGLMPDVANTPSGPFSESLPLARLAEIGLEAVRQPGEPIGTFDRVDRMDVRPGDGYVKVRIANAASTEVTVDLASGRVLHIGRRGDVFLERLHSGEAFGKIWVLLSDAAAIGLVVTLLTGYWLWLAPKLRHADAPVETQRVEPR